MTNLIRISGQPIPDGEAIEGHEIRESEYPDFNQNSFISIHELNKYRRVYLTSLISREMGEAGLLL
jgi:hypothetical protein